MALIKCPKCGKEISDKATNCVGCGWKVEPIKDCTKEQTSKLQRAVMAKSEKNFSNVSIFFMMFLVLVITCSMIVVWVRLDKLEAEIDIVKSNKEIEFEISKNDIGNGRVKDLEENKNQEELENNNDQEETSNGDSQNENVVDEYDQWVETEVNSENIVSSDEDENFNVEFEYTDNKVSDYYVDIFVKITNKTETTICITSQKYLYLNDISIERAYAKVDEEIPSGKSALFEIAFERQKIEAAGISTINSLVCQYDITEKVDSENITSGEITFEGLGININ